MLLRVGSQGAEVIEWQQWFGRKYAAYAPPVDGYYGYADRDATKIMQAQLRVPVTGEFDDVTAAAAGYGNRPGIPESSPRTSTTWVYSAAGTRGHWSQGPQFAVGGAAKAAGKQHQPLAYPAAGFFGQPDPGVSYLESIEILCQEWARLLRINREGDIVAVGYSQSADGFIRAALRLFGPGGEFESQRHRLRRIVALGNPCRQRGSGAAPGWGISRLVLPDWLAPLVRDVTTTGDLYACAEDTTLVPLFYPWFIRAETSLAFAGYSAQVVVPAIASFLGIAAPLLGGVLGAGGAAIIAAVTGLALPLITQLISGYADAPAPDSELVEALSAQGLLRNMPKLVATLAALANGVRIHGEYHLPKPEFGGRTGIDVGVQLVNEIA